LVREFSHAWIIRRRILRVANCFVRYAAFCFGWRGKKIADAFQNAFLAFFGWRWRKCSEARQYLLQIHAGWRFRWRGLCCCWFKPRQDLIEVHAADWLRLGRDRRCEALHAAVSAGKARRQVSAALNRWRLVIRIRLESLRKLAKNLFCNVSARNCANARLRL